MGRRVRLRLRSGRRRRFEAEHARAQHDGRRAGDVDDGALDADATRAAVEDQQIAGEGAEGVGDVKCRRRRNRLRAIRARRREREAAGPQQREGHRMRRNAQPDRLAARRHRSGDRARLLDDERQRPRPMRRREARRRFGPAPRERAGGGLALDVDDQRIGRGPALRGEDPGDRGFIEGVRAEAVDGLGRKGDEPAPREDAGGFGQGLGGRGEDASGHGATLPRRAWPHRVDCARIFFRTVRARRSAAAGAWEAPCPYRSTNIRSIRVPSR